MNQITVRDMLEQMETGMPFSLTYVTYDHNRRKGGKLISYMEAKLAKHDEIAKKNRGRTTVEDTRARKQRIKEGRDPRHQKWYTRNITILQNGTTTSLIKKIHPPLVTIFNNQIVVA